jgi:signal transduction histidine kinase
VTPQIRRLERWLVYVRWFGVAFGAISIGVEPDYPGIGTRLGAWTLIALLAVGNLVIWRLLKSRPSESDLSHLTLGTFVFDTLVILTIVWLYAFEDPYVTWALLILIPMEGALRFRLKGAMIGAAIVAVFFIPQSIRRAVITDEPFDFPTYVFLVGFSTLVAAITGSMAKSWHIQNEAFQNQSLKLAELDELKDRFLAVTSHEIRTPLTSVIAGIETLRNRSDQLDESEKQRMLGMMSTQSRNLARLVDDLLVTSQLQSGNLGLRAEWADVEETVQQAVDGAASKRREHLLELFLEPIRCEIDAPRVAQIVRNLVENAYKYTPAGTRVAVTAKGEAEGLVIEVSDEGRGIPPEHRDSLFEAFRRIEEMAAGVEGVGLGLFVVSQLVSAMHGQIDLVSSSRGTTFTIHIPCQVTPKERRHLDVVRDDEASG